MGWDSSERYLLWIYEVEPNFSAAPRIQESLIVLAFNADLWEICVPFRAEVPHGIAEDAID